MHHASRFRRLFEHVSLPSVDLIATLLLHPVSLCELCVLPAPLACAFDCALPPSSLILCTGSKLNHSWYVSRNGHVSAKWISPVSFKRPPVLHWSCRSLVTEAPNATFTIIAHIHLCSILVHPSAAAFFFVTPHDYDLSFHVVLPIFFSHSLLFSWNTQISSKLWRRSHVLQLQVDVVYMNVSWKS